MLPGNSVTALLSMTLWSRAGVGLLLLTFTALGAPAASPRRVLIVHSFVNAAPPFTIHSTAFETTLTTEFGERVDLDEITVDAARYAAPDMEEALVEYIRKRQEKWQPDLVVPVGSPAGVFVAKHRDRLFPMTPVIYTGMDRRRLPPDAFQKNATFVGESFDFPAMLENILQVAPATTNIAVVLGASQLEQYWAVAIQHEWMPFTNRVGFTWLNDLSFDQMLERVSTLPPRSFIFLVLLMRDASGVTHNADEALHRIHAVANAPVNSIFKHQLGLGIVGGRLYQAELEGEESARIAIRILRGEPATNFPPLIVEPAGPRYDWRELRRWNIGEERLPSGSVVLFREPTAWDRYWRMITGTALFCLLQAVLIVSLLINRARRRRGEAEATLIAEVSSKFVNLPPGEVDFEVGEAQRRIFELLDLDVSGFWQWSAADSGFFRLTHYSRAGEGPQIPERMNSQEYFPWYQQQVLAGRTIAVRSMTELPPEAARDRETFRQFGFKSNLTIPLAVGGEPPIGALGFNTTRAERDWPDALVKRLQLVAQIFANALARQRADQVSRESEARFRMVADTAPVLIWMSGSDKLRNFFNKGWLDFTGRPLAAELADGWTEGLHPDELPKYLKTYVESFGARVPFMMEYRLRRHDGEYRWISDHGVPRYDSTQVFLGYIGSCLDITGRKQADQMAREFGGRLLQAQEAERARLARELHDDITQRLARLAIDAGRVEPKRDGAAFSETMRNVRDGLVRLSEDVHSLSYRLHPALLEDLGLADALRAECERFTRQEAIPVEVKLEKMAARIPPDTALCLFRVTQEALRNVARHARTRSAAVSLRQLDGGLQLAVTDAGVGFDPGQERSRPSLGLASMRERVRLLGGELDIESAPGYGTTIVSWVPMKGELS